MNTCDSVPPPHINNWLMPPPHTHAHTHAHTHTHHKCMHTHKHDMHTHSGKCFFCGFGGKGLVVRLGKLTCTTLANTDVTQLVMSYSDELHPSMYTE